jgi:hypothetical protein
VLTVGLEGNLTIISTAKITTAVLTTLLFAATAFGRDFAYEGATDTFFYKDLTDSENGATIHSGKDLKSKTKWDHDVLKVITTQSGSVTESYSLAADGSMLASVVRPEQKSITLVFQRK